LLLDIEPYTYKMLQADNFYKYAYNHLRQYENIEIITGEIAGHEENEKGVEVYVNGKKYSGNKFFKSFLDKNIELEPKYFVAQHFKGWFIQTRQDVFDTTSATFMDFFIDQYGETRFFYVLPTAPNKALVEIAIFSNDVMHPKEYDPIIRQYISNNYPNLEYKIIEEEFGVIPMTSYPFWKHNTSRVLHIGGAGGAIKCSSGYAFSRILEHTDAILGCLTTNKSLSTINNFWKDRFYLYDKTLLDVLLVQKFAGDKIFDAMFAHVAPQKIFKFLDRETSIFEEISIFRKMPLFPFIRGMIRNTPLR